jgi:hypothetical protein
MKVFLNKTTSNPNDGIGIACEPIQGILGRFSILCSHDIIRFWPHNVRNFTLTRRKIVDEIITEFLTDEFHFANPKPFWVMPFFSSDKYCFVARQIILFLPQG